MDHLSVAQAQKCILDSAERMVSRLDAEPVGLAHCLGRVLAADVRAIRDLPPCDVSAMDGYAVRSTDLEKLPVSLEIIEDIKAGDMPGKTVLAGQCARIMTGAPVPDGADAVIRVEDTQSLSERMVQINLAVMPGSDIRSQGESMRNGDVVLTAGTEITPGVIGVLATVKCAQVQVYRHPSVAILSTGNELEDIDDPVDPSKIPDSNSYALMAQLQALGIEPSLLGIARDDPAELAEYLQRGLKFDVLLVSGGTSVGMHDYVRPAIEALGVGMKFWRVAMKPGHPVAFGTTAKTAVFCLPGNPVSSMVCFEQLVAPALRSMMGHTRLYRRTITARLTHSIKHQPGRTEFIRVILKRDGYGLVASSTGSQGSGMLMSMAKADGLLIIPADSAELSEGELVTVQLFDSAVFQQEPDITEGP